MLTGNQSPSQCSAVFSCGLEVASSSPQSHCAGFSSGLFIRSRLKSLRCPHHWDEEVVDTFTVDVAPVASVPVNAAHVKNPGHFLPQPVHISLSSPLSSFWLTCTITPVLFYRFTKAVIIMHDIAQKVVIWRLCVAVWTDHNYNLFHVTTCFSDHRL